jgi:hypothetical protein
VNPWLRELVQILAAVAVEDVADGPDEPAPSTDAATERDPREPGSSGTASSQQDGSGDCQPGCLSAEGR